MFANSIAIIHRRLQRHCALSFASGLDAQPRSASIMRVSPNVLTKLQEGKP